MKRNLLFLLLLMFTGIRLWSQQPPGACTPPIILASTCAESCVVCDIDGFTADNNSTDLGMAPPGFCAPQLHNTQWVGFVAGSTNLVLRIDIFNCTSPANNGLQIGVYGTQNCEDFQLVSECYPAIPGNTFAIFNCSGLQVGGIYFIVIDGNVGDICSFTVTVESGLGSAPLITGNTSIQAAPPFCPGGTFPFSAAGVNGASIYTWTLNGQIVGYEQTTDITVPASGNSFQVCVTPSNPCHAGTQVCQTYPITPLPLNNLGTVTICQGQSYSYGGMTFTQQGLYNFNSSVGNNGCLQPTRLNLIVQPPQFKDLGIKEICADESFLVSGMPAVPGANTFHLHTAAGCDSTVTVFLIVHPLGGTLIDEDICQGEHINVHDNFGHSYNFSTTGTFQVTLTSSFGCDSFIFVNLQVFQPPPHTNLVRTICQGDYFLLGSSAYSTSGTYTATIETAAGCDSMVTLNLTVINPMSTVNKTICAGQSVTIGTSTYNTTGMYTKVLPHASALGCDSTVHLNLTVLPAINTNLNATICQGESYAVGSTNYTSSGSYNQTFPASNGCDSMVHLNLTVLPVPVTNLSPVLCYGESYAVGGTTYTASGVYHDTLTALNGCDSIVNLNLTIRPEITTSLVINICEDETYSVGPSTYNTSGAYLNVLTATNGCDSIVYLNLTVLDIPETNLAISICQGNSYSVGSSDYTATGQYTDVLTAANGCDSIVHLNLTVIPPTVYPITGAICTGQTYTVGTSSYDVSGVYFDTLSSSIGCDSIVRLTLTVADILETDLAPSICEGESFTVGSSTYNQTGDFDDFFVTSTGCDSVVHLHLTVLDVPETFLDINICNGESFGVGSSTYNATGTYTNVLTAANGCDSIIHLDLTVLNVPMTNLDINICDGESYAVGSSSYNISGTYTDVLTAANGCDSIVHLDLTVLNVPVTNLDINICEGETYGVGSSSYNATGSYTDILTAANGCDSIVNLSLTVLDVPETFLTELICNGEAYSLGGSNYTTTGNYQEIFTAANGCDSIVHLNLTVAPIPNTNIVTSICTGSSYHVGGSTYTDTGNYIDTLSSVVTGCDSIVFLNLTVTSFYETNLTEFICDGESFTVGSSNYTATGVYQDMFISQDGCDSLVNLNLTVYPVPVTNLDITICDGENYGVGNSSYTTTGVYQDVLQTTHGCDSIVNLNLIVNPVFVTNLTQEICDGESFGVGNSNYTVTGVYQDVLTSANGCDSTVNLNLTVHAIPVTNLTEIVCNGDTYGVGSSVYNASGVYQDVLTSTITGCDSIVNLNLTVRPAIQTALTQVLCFGDTYSVGNSTYNATGTYTDVLTSAATGCDSTVTLNLTIRAELVTSLVQSICDGESYGVGSSSYTTSGTYQDVLSSVVTGCDSTVNLQLTVIPLPQTTLNEAICDGESYSVGSSTYTTSGTYQDILTAASGCDSIVMLHLNVMPNPTTNLTPSICQGETYQVGASTYSATGNYTNVLTAANGCDSTVFLNLTVIPTAVTNLTQAICQGESYGVGSSSYTASGSYQDILTAASGCDSIVNLALTVHPVYNVTLMEAICDDDVYIVGTNSFNSTGTFVTHLSSVNGCDSTVTLNLTVYPCNLTFNLGTSNALCNGSANGSITFSMTRGTGPYVYNWQRLPTGQTGSGTITGNDVNTVINNLPAGNYSITVTDSYNIQTVIAATVQQPTVLNATLTASNFNNFGVSCADAEDGSYTANPTGGTPPYSYHWSTGGAGATINNLAAGSYNVTITDQNGCQTQALGSLTAPEPLKAAVETTDPACFGDNAGLITVSDPSGGVGPYLFASNDRPFSSAPLIANLPVGVYTVMVQDANGCIYEQEVIINQPEELVVSLGDDKHITLGDSVRLVAQTSYDVNNFIWKQDSTLSCVNCFDPIASPMSTNSYVVTVMDENGCRASDQITVFVDKERQVYIPNGFSPNNDGQNDVFMIFAGPDVRKIKSFLLFNRWGETLFELYNFQPNDPAYGWDGTHRGRAMNTGVYVYLAEIEFIDGEVILYKGDVLLRK